MKQYIKIVTALTAVVTGMWMTATFSFAHYLWVNEMNNGYSVCRGSSVERIESYDTTRVKQISAQAPDGTGLTITRENKNGQVVFTVNGKPALVAVTSEWGDRVNTTRGKKFMNRQAAEAEGLTVVSAFVSTQFSKTLFAPSASNCQSLGLKFEIIPLTDPMTSMPGKPVAFKLLFDGQPLSGISIFTNNDRESETDENGVAQFSFEKRGVHLLYATHQTPAGKNSDLDFLKFMTFLTFEVK